MKKKVIENKLNPFFIFTVGRARIKMTTKHTFLLYSQIKTIAVGGMNKRTQNKNTKNKKKNKKIRTQKVI